jgi:trehalose-phosphatase
MELCRSRDCSNCFDNCLYFYTLRKALIKMKIEALFLDYDGTLSPLNTARNESRVPPHLEALLYLIRKQVPIAMITTKDMSFIVPRTLFAYAWGAIAGLELRIGDRIFHSTGVDEKLTYLDQALEYARAHTRLGAIIEEKHSSTGRPLAFCIDWRSVKDPKEARLIASQIKDYCRELTLEVIEYKSKPYFDVFPCTINKGKTLSDLKEYLHITGKVLYMGDSITDNSALQAADTGIGVSPRKEPVDLDCQYWLKFNDLPLFLNVLYKNNMVLSPNLAGLKTRG